VTQTQALAADDPRWLATFPQRVAPRPDEWLPGLLLRCDAANGWAAGTTAAFIHTRRYGLRPGVAPTLGVVAVDLDLSRLATLLALPLDDLDQTTLRPALGRLYPLMTPRAHLLGPIPRFRVCPRCVAEDTLLARWLALPLLRNCPRHGVLFQDICRCGVRLEPFHRRANPFTCARCHAAWRDLPTIAPDDADGAIDAAARALYAPLLEAGVRTTLPDALYLARQALAERGQDTFSLRTVRGVSLPAKADGMPALAPLIAALMSLGLTARHLATLPPSGSRSSLRCTDQVCPVFNADQAHAMRVRQHGRCYGVYESYCAECGSAFLDTHLALTCTVGARLTRAHTYPMAPSIARRQAHLSVWRLRLEYACAEMLVAGEPISVRVAFQRAQIPPSVRRRIAWAPLVRVADDYAALVEARGAISFRAPNVIRGPDAPMLSAVEQVPTA